VDFLMRKYGFRDADVPFDAQGNLSLETDPKEAWARGHPEHFPLNVNRASRLELLRVPGLGPITVDRILRLRRTQRIGSLAEIGPVGARLGEARHYVSF
jgi:predicted DNA-binding helix-hairpin-helix protein